MAMTRLLLHTYPRETSPPEDVFTHLNKLLFGNLLPGQFVTAFYSILDTTGASLFFSNAGHCHPILLHAGEKRIEQLKTKGGLPLGIVPNGTFDMKSVKIDKGDLLFFYTDGLVEAMDSSKQMFGEDRLKDILINSMDKDLQEVKERILAGLKAFCGSLTLKDDLTFLIMKIT